MSNRKITSQQFSAGTTVDADRLDVGLQDTEEYLNNVPGGDLLNRYTRTQIVAGWTAYQKTVNEFQAPWLRGANTTADTHGSGTPLHPSRVKGNAGGYWEWTTSIYFEHPCVIDALDMMWQIYTGSDFTTNKNPQTLWGTGATNGLGCSITVADPQNTESPKSNSVVLQLTGTDLGGIYWPAESMSTNPAIFSGSLSDMLPPAPLAGIPSNLTTQSTDELWLQRKNIQKHIPANSRVSFTIALQGSGGTDTYMGGSPNLVVTILEPLVK